MNTIIYSLSIFIIICIFLMWYIITYNNFQSFIIRTNEAEANIDSCLRKRFDLLLKVSGIIKIALQIEDEPFPELTPLKSKKLTNFDLDRELYNSINKFYFLIEEHPELKNNEEIMKVIISLNESEIEISALHKYYNDIITDYNKLVRNFPSSLTASISGYKTKTYFDGKNMEDEIKNDFKL